MTKKHWTSDPKKLAAAVKKRSATRRRSSMKIVVGAKMPKREKKAEQWQTVMRLARIGAQMRIEELTTELEMCRRVLGEK